MGYMAGGMVLTVSAQSEDKVLAQFEGETYGEWTTEGTAFGTGPAKGTLPGQMKVRGYVGKGLVNSFNGDTGRGCSQDRADSRKRARPRPCEAKRTRCGRAGNKQRGMGVSPMEDMGTCGMGVSPMNHGRDARATACDARWRLGSVSAKMWPSKGEQRRG